MGKKSNYHRTKERLLFDEIIMNFKPYYSVCKNSSRWIPYTLIKFKIPLRIRATARRITKSLKTALNLTLKIYSPLSSRQYKA